MLTLYGKDPMTYIAPMEQTALKIRMQMARIGMQNKELAAAIGKSPQTVSGYTRLSEPKTPDLKTLKKIAGVLGVSVEYLLSEDLPTSKELDPDIKHLQDELEKFDERDRPEVVNFLNTALEFMRKKKGA